MLTCYSQYIPNMDLRTYYHTVRHLKFKQIYYQIRHRLCRANGKRISYSSPVQKNGTPLLLCRWISKNKSLLHGRIFEFLNIKTPFTDWNDEQQGKLWIYNLNYMDYLLQPDISFNEASGWINKFIDDSQNNRVGWESYPIALRGVNWIKFISANHLLISHADVTKWDTSLYNQYQYLYHNLEFHLQGNHLLEDACSLLWGGLYFGDDKWYEKAVWLLVEELNEQILADGAHYELSPMYHAILLDRLLDCINALEHNPYFKGQDNVTYFLKEKARMMLGWLNAIIYKDGTIPLLNDAAYGIAPSPQKLFVYADLLGIRWPVQTLKECGYRKFITNTFEMILDVGNIGPDYIPGHAHADTFNYELRVNGKPFIIDSGISTYNKNTRRQYERETQAHNTVQAEGLNSSNVWGGFRVAQRAKITYLKEDMKRIIARHDGFRASGIEHQRTFELKKQEIIIDDKLLPLEDRKGLNHIHLHPDVKILSVDDHVVRTDIGTISFRGIDKVWTEPCKVAFEYNKLIPSHKICLAFTNQMYYTIRPDIILSD